jgi:peptide/nickel transport system permease protein
VPPVVKFILRRLITALALVLGSSVIVFVLMEIIPGDPAFFVVGRDADPTLIERVRETLGLNDPAYIRYFRWLGHFVQGEFGRSAVLIDTNLNEYIRDRIFNTFVLASVTFALMVPASLALGVIAAVRRGKMVDHIVSGLILFSVGFPDFVLGILFITFFAVKWRLLPAIATFQFDPSLGAWVQSLILPVATLLIVALPQTVRLVRASMIDALDSEYVEGLRLRGVPERAVVWRHALPNALGPSIQSLALNAAWLLGGVVIVENLFNYPGLGQAMISSLLSHDVPLIESITCLLVLAYIAITTIADLVQIGFDTRLREFGRV